MKAQVLYEYDPEMKRDIWVEEAEMPEPKIEKSSDVIVKIGAAGVCRTDLHIIEGVWRHIQDPDNKLLPCVMGHAPPVEGTVQTSKVTESVSASPAAGTGPWLRTYKLSAVVM